jgi:putative membrane protein
MFINLLLFILLGILLGTITGLTPGIHINLLSVLLLSVLPLFKITPLHSSVVIVSMAVTHTFLDTIPSTFLGVAEEDTALALLPSHKLLLEGKGYEAVMLTVVGSLGGLIFVILLSPLTLIITPIVYSFLQEHIGILLIVISLILILRESNRFWAIVLFFLSGLLGIAVFDLPITEPLFPLFSGLFGVSMLLMSVYNKVAIPKQEVCKIDTTHSFRSIIVATFIGSFASFMPGLGPAQAATLSSYIITIKEKAYLILIGSLSTANMIFSFVTLYTIDKARNGAVIAVSELFSITGKDFVILLCVSLLVGGIATILAIYITKVFSKVIVRINYPFLCWTIIIFIVVSVFVISSWVGLVVLFVSCALGIIPAVKKVSRSHMMGCILLPVILYFV